MTGAELGGREGAQWVPNAPFSPRLKAKSPLAHTGVAQGPHKGQGQILTRNKQNKKNTEGVCRECSLCNLPSASTHRILAKFLLI